MDQSACFEIQMLLTFYMFPIVRAYDLSDKGAWKCNETLGGRIFTNYDTAETFWIPSTYVACRIFWTTVFFVSFSRKISVSPPIVSITIDQRITTFWKIQKIDIDKCSCHVINSQNWWIQPEGRVKNFAGIDQDSGLGLSCTNYTRTECKVVRHSYVERDNG